ncbi:MAG: FAD-dependent oxidoreductase, partial [Microlunatus sp.]|nr:FAD-dependent oxidoreductase [Microlunatus sp.]
PRLLVAGAWTATGWPATMEGAVRSGERAASLALDAGPGEPDGEFLSDAHDHPRVLRRRVKEVAV